MNIPIRLTDASRDVDFLSPAEFSALTGISIATVRRYLKSGRLPKLQPGGARCRVSIPISVLKEWTDAKKTEMPSTFGDLDTLIPFRHPKSGPTPNWKKRINNFKENDA